MIVCDLETSKTIECVSYTNCVHRLSKISGKYHRDITDREYEKCKKDCFVFKGTDSINETLDHVLQIKGEPKRVKTRIVKYSLILLAHKWSGFDSYVVLNKLPKWRTVVKIIKNGSGIVSLKLFKDYVNPVQIIPQIVLFGCGFLHFKDYLKKIGKS